MGKDQKKNLLSPYKMPKKLDAAKAKAAASKVKKSTKKASHKVYFKARFFKPKVRHQKRASKLLKHVNKHIALEDAADPHKVIIQPISSDKNVQKMENENTLTFIVAPKATKPQIAQVFAKLHNVKVRSVNTMFRPDGKKKAYIRLSSGSDSLKVASKIGIL